MTHPRLQAFFEGAVDELRAAHKKSKFAPGACKGSLREQGVHRAVAHCLPSVARVYEGEVIDSTGGQSGQLDGIVVHATGSALATAPEESRVVLAEGVISVIESKSSLRGQWDEVLGTWKKVGALRRPLAGRAMLGTMAQHERAIPFVVIGWQGWAQKKTVAEKTRNLLCEFEGKFPPPILLVQLDPPGIGEASSDDEGNAEAKGEVFGEDDRWRTLAAVWFRIGHAARRIVTASVDWKAYLWS